MKSIIKARRVYGQNLYLRDITVDDAKFVFDLRTDPEKSRHLSATSGRLEDQVNWIINYTFKQDQAYFIVCDKEDNKLGCIRMYNPIGESYCWGSWLMIKGLGPVVAIESALLIYAYGKNLGFREARIDVRQENEYVWKFHEKFSSAELVRQDAIDRYYVVSENKIDRLLARYSGLFSKPLLIETL
ncbi:MAG: GNAT family N-acetyltransferase [Alphaproteobacteria bacterium]|nr:GNAT family N-acetyltransferase [Alphaproteobacteria bacterium]